LRLDQPVAAASASIGAARAADGGQIALERGGAVVGAVGIQVEPRHCEERSDEAIHRGKDAALRPSGLLRFARNDGSAIPIQCRPL